MKKQTTIHRLAGRMTAFFKKETVLCVAAVLAALSVILVPPDRTYLEYPDYRVLALLFCLMLVVAGLQSIGLFRYLGFRLLRGIRNTFQLNCLLVALPFAASMFITNDVALITFVPFAVMTLTMARQQKLLIPVVVLQTIGANLGSMLTPVGNPQNLYLYTVFDLSMASFLRDMLPLTLLSLLLLAAAVWFQGRTLLAVQTLEMPKAPDRKKLAAYGILFLVCLTCVLRLLSWPVMLAVLMLAVLLIDRSLFRSVDYFLLLTFVCFFLFIGNMERIPAVASLMRELIDGRELPVSVGLSQVISNVPAAILLSGFTEKVRSLLYGVNIGGLGTLIASLASVISYRIYGGSKEAQKGKYMKTFTVYNVIFLVVLYVAAAALLSPS
ncbi:SLC13 family permease [Acetatifactor muris]|uniref:SLC13 family permease n=1 Tax=Acetatifactor muris TaxID=879566 RepID=UPI0023F14F55|nr:SLC13 family permease [Acetatifactor muris]